MIYTRADIDRILSLFLLLFLFYDDIYLKTYLSPFVSRTSLGISWYRINDKVLYKNENLELERI